MDQSSRIPPQRTASANRSALNLPAPGSVVTASVEEDLGDGVYSLRWAGQKIAVSSRAALKPGQNLLLKSETSAEGKPTLVVQGPAPDKPKIQGRVIYGPGIRGQGGQGQAGGGQGQTVTQGQTAGGDQVDVSVHRDGRGTVNVGAPGSVGGNQGAGAQVAAGVVKAEATQSLAPVQSLVGEILEPLPSFRLSVETMMDELEREKEKLRENSDAAKAKKEEEKAKKQHDKAKAAADAQSGEGEAAATAGRRGRQGALLRSDAHPGAGGQTAQAGQGGPAGQARGPAAGGAVPPGQSVPAEPGGGPAARAVPPSQTGPEPQTGRTVPAEPDAQTGRPVPNGRSGPELQTGRAVPTGQTGPEPQTGRAVPAEPDAQTSRPVPPGQTGPTGQTGQTGPAYQASPGQPGGPPGPVAQTGQTGPAASGVETGPGDPAKPNSATPPDKPTSPAGPADPPRPAVEPGQTAPAAADPRRPAVDPGRLMPNARGPEIPTIPPDSISRQSEAADPARRAINPATRHYLRNRLDGHPPLPATLTNQTGPARQNSSAGPIVPETAPPVATPETARPAGPAGTSDTSGTSGTSGSAGAAGTAGTAAPALPAAVVSQTGPAGSPAPLPPPPSGQTAGQSAGPVLPTNQTAPPPPAPAPAATPTPAPTAPPPPSPGEALPANGPTPTPPPASSTRVFHPHAGAYPPPPSSHGAGMNPEIYTKEALTQVVKSSELPLPPADNSLGIGGKMPQSIVDKAAGLLLQAAGLSQDDHTMNAARALIRNNVPVDRESIQALIAAVAEATPEEQEALMKAAARLVGKDIPVTPPLVSGLADIMQRQDGIHSLMDKARAALELPPDAVAAAPAGTAASNGNVNANAAGATVATATVTGNATATTAANANLNAAANLSALTTLAGPIIPPAVSPVPPSPGQNPPLTPDVPAAPAAQPPIPPQSVSPDIAKMMTGAGQLLDLLHVDLGSSGAPEALERYLSTFGRETLGKSLSLIELSTQAVLENNPLLRRIDAAMTEILTILGQGDSAAAGQASGQTAAQTTAQTAGQTPPADPQAAPPPNQPAPLIAGGDAGPRIPEPQAVPPSGTVPQPPAASGQTAPPPVPPLPLPILPAGGPVIPNVPAQVPTAPASPAPTGDTPAAATVGTAQPSDAVPAPESDAAPQDSAAGADSSAYRPSFASGINAYLHSPRAFNVAEALKNLPPMPKVASLNSPPGFTPPLPQTPPAAQTTSQTVPQPPPPSPESPLPPPQTPPQTPPQSLPPTTELPPPQPPLPTVPPPQIPLPQIPPPQIPLPLMPPLPAAGLPFGEQQQHPGHPGEGLPNPAQADPNHSIPSPKAAPNQPASGPAANAPVPGTMFLDPKSGVLQKLDSLFQMPGLNKPAIELLKPSGFLDSYLAAPEAGPDAERIKQEAANLFRRLTSDNGEQTRKALEELRQKEPEVLKETATRLAQREQETLRSDPLIHKLTDAATSLRDLGRQLLAVKAENLAGQDRNPGVMLAEVPFKLGDDTGDGRMQMFYRKSKGKNDGWTQRVILDLNTTKLGSVLGDMRFFNQDMILNVFLQDQTTADYLQKESEDLVDSLWSKGFRVKARFMVVPPPPAIQAARPQIEGEGEAAPATAAAAEALPEVRRSDTGRHHLDVKG